MSKNTSKKVPSDTYLLMEMVRFGTDAIFTPEEREVLGLMYGEICELDGPWAKRLIIFTIDWDLVRSTDNKTWDLEVAVSDDMHFTLPIVSYYDMLYNILGSWEEEDNKFLRIFKRMITYDLDRFCTELESADFSNRSFRRWHNRFDRMFSMLSCYVNTDDWGEGYFDSEDNDCSDCNCPYNSGDYCIQRCPYDGAETWCDHKEEYSGKIADDGTTDMYFLDGCSDSEELDNIYPYFGRHNADLEKLRPDTLTPVHNISLTFMSSLGIYVQVPTVGCVELIGYLCYTLVALYDTLKKKEESLANREAIDLLRNIITIIEGLVNKDVAIHASTLLMSVDGSTKIRANTENLQASLNDLHHALATINSYISSDNQKSTEMGMVEDVRSIKDRIGDLLATLSSAVRDYQHYRVILEDTINEFHNEDLGDIFDGSNESVSEDFNHCKGCDDCGCPHKNSPCPYDESLGQVWCDYHDDEECSSPFAGAINVDRLNDLDVQSRANHTFLTCCSDTIFSGIKFDMNDFIKPETRHNLYNIKTDKNYIEEDSTMNDEKWNRYTPDREPKDGFLDALGEGCAEDEYGDWNDASPLSLLLKKLNEFRDTYMPNKGDDDEVEDDEDDEDWEIPPYRNFTDREAAMLESLMRVRFIMKSLGPDNIDNTFWLVREIMSKPIEE